ncbi:hypothetical protein HZS_2957 [Henneguya salminicola]|nr:hypothetical protein HZS_2957 [Henneguya salminicola]
MSICFRDQKKEKGSTIKSTLSFNDPNMFKEKKKNIRMKERISFLVSRKFTPKKIHKEKKLNDQKLYHETDLNAKVYNKSKAFCSNFLDPLYYKDIQFRAYSSCSILYL